MCFQCPYEGGEGVWVQDNPGAPERNGCIVAEGFREHTETEPQVKLEIPTTTLNQIGELNQPGGINVLSRCR